MKKLLAILLVLAMLSALSVSAAAATATAENVLTWTDFEEDVKATGIDADFVQIGDLNLMMWLPSVFSEAELTDEDIQNGYVSYLTTDDESAVIAIMSKDLGISLEEWEQELPDYGVTVSSLTVRAETVFLLNTSFSGLKI